MTRYDLNPETIREYRAELRFRRRMKCKNDARIIELERIVGTEPCTHCVKLVGDNDTICAKCLRVVA